LSEDYRKKSIIHQIHKGVAVKIQQMVFVVVVVLLGWLAPEGKAVDGQKDEVAVPYSLMEMQSTWLNHFQQVFDQQLFLGRYPIPEIQDRYDQAVQLIEKRYGSGLAVNMVTTYDKASTDVLCGNCFKDGHPTAEIMIPKLLDICKGERQRNPNGWQDRMRLVLVVGLMHELDHLASGPILKEGEKPLPLDQLVDEETRVWALTCENTLRPLIEKYKAQLTEDEYIIYNQWLKSRRDESSPTWRNFIHWAYSRTRQSGK